MQVVVSPLSDSERLAALLETGLLDTPPEEPFDALVRLGCTILHAPIAGISLMRADRQFLKSSAGFREPWASTRQIPLSHSFCQYVVTSGERLLIEDARKHDWVKHSPGIRDMGVIAYAGMPLRTTTGHTLGTLFVADTLPRAWGEEEVEVLTDLATAAMSMIELHAARHRAIHPPEAHLEQRWPALHRISGDEQFEIMVEQSLVGFYVIQQGGFRYVNPKFAEIFGYTEEELVTSRRVADLVVVEDRAVVEEHLQRRLRGDLDAVQYSFRGLCRDGRIIHVEVHGTRVQIEGEPAVVGVLLDITEREQAQEALRQSEERYRVVARATNDIIRDWDVVTGSLHWNDSAPKLLRYAAGEIGTTVEWWYERIHPEDRERVTGGLHRSVGGTDDHWVDEYRFLRGDGSYATLLDRGFVVRDARGVPLRMIGSIMDVSDRKWSEETQRILARASALLDASLDQDAEATCTSLARLVVPSFADCCLVDLVEGDGIRRVAASHTNPTLERMLSGCGRHPLADDPDSHPLLRAIGTRAPVLLPDGNGGIDPCSHLAAEDERRRSELRASSLICVPMVVHDRVMGAISLATTSSGRHYGPMDLMIAEDLTRRAALALENARLYRELQDSVKAREEILGVVSHDLRNPLNTIKLSADLLHDASKERRSSHLQWLDVIRRAAGQMNHLIEDLLDLSTIEAGQFAVTQAEQDLAALFQEACSQFQPLTDERSIRLEYDTEGELPTVWVDSGQILRVFSNLVGNAIKFTPEGGTIRLGARRGQAEVIFSVSDSGPGIGPEHLPHVFDRYWQARRGDRRGAGLGLAIARGIVEAHGGRIWVESEPGRGATFCFSIPDRSAEPQAAPVPEPRSPAPDPSSGGSPGDAPPTADS